MAALNDEIVRVTGGPTVNDGLAAHFSKTATESMQDAEARWLDEQLIAPAASSAIADRWRQFGVEQAVSAGLHLNDIKLAYWSSK